MSKKNKIPKYLQPLLWCKSPKNIDLERDKVYIIHQVLSLGNLKHLKWLFKTYSFSTIKKTFLRYPKKIYRPAALQFVKIILRISNKKINEKKYCKTLLGSLR